MSLIDYPASELHRRISGLEEDIQRVCTVLEGPLGGWSRLDLYSEMTYLLEDLDRLQAEVRRRRGLTIAGLLEPERRTAS
jgi:hypothetical protein